MSSSNLLRYLNRYAEPEAYLGAFLNIEEKFDYNVVLPVCDELDYFSVFVENLKKACSFAHKKILLIVIVNRNVDSEQRILKSNEELYSFWLKKLKAKNREEKKLKFFYGQEDSLGFLFIDKNTSGFELARKRGVGLARKIGCDIACSLYHQEVVSSNHIFTTDCDALLPENFFLIKKPSSDYFLMLSSFSHKFQGPESKVHQQAMPIYEGYLRYYVRGLKKAGSPYAFHTIGSLLSFSVEAYALVRGFPKKKMAGEDFYFQNKIAKVSDYYEHKADPIILSCRLSQRVPFGTGRSLLKIIELLKQKKSYKVESPLCFSYLGLFLKVADSYLGESEFNQAGSLLVRKFKETMGSASCLNFTQFFCFLQKEGFIKELERVYRSHSVPQGRRKNFHDWFDAFKTLKFMHKLEDSFVPSVPYSDFLLEDDSLKF